jgi:hypothetical protein
MATSRQRAYYVATSRCFMFDQVMPALLFHVTNILCSDAVQYSPRLVVLVEACGGAAPEQRFRADLCHLQTIRLETESV